VPTKPEVTGSGTVGLLFTKLVAATFDVQAPVEAWKQISEATYAGVLPGGSVLNTSKLEILKLALLARATVKVSVPVGPVPPEQVVQWMK
jgi:hypothetical protein